MNEPLHTQSFRFNSIAECLDDIRQGRMIIVTDDEDRENEGDLIMAAEKVTPEAVNFMTKHGRGLICVPTTEARLKALGIGRMVAENRESFKTDFMVSVDARDGITTGISAPDRARSIRVLADPNAAPEHLVSPGHIFPLQAREGGVLRRAGHTEASVDLVKTAGLLPVAVLCEILNEDGTMARLPDLMKFKEQFGLKICTIRDFIEYRRVREKLVAKEQEVALPTAYGEFKLHLYRSLVDGQHHAALVMGDVRGKENILVRVHSECLTGDVFGSLRCDCGPQLQASLDLIEKEGRGVLIYLRGHEGRGIGLGHKIRAYQLQEEGHDTVDANLAQGLPVDSREYGIGAQMLVDLGVTTMRLMTNNPVKYGGLEGFGLDITERVPLQSQPNPENIEYLRTKRERMGHLLEGLDDVL